MSMEAKKVEYRKSVAQDSRFRQFRSWISEVSHTNISYERVIFGWKGIVCISFCHTWNPKILPILTHRSNRNTEYDT